MKDVNYVHMMPVWCATHEYVM